MPKVTLADIDRRIARMETRLVNGLNQLGLDPCTKLEEGDITVDKDKKIVHISHTSLTVGVILFKLAKINAPHGDYKVLCGGIPCLDVTYTGEQDGL